MTAAPIAPRLPIVGHLFDFRGDPLRFLRSMRERHGDVVDVSLGPLEVTLLSHPDLVEDVLVTRNKLFRKDRFLQTIVRPVLGEGLLTSEGDFWRRQRRLAQPAFHRDRIATYGRVMVEYTERMLQNWADGQRRDVQADMMQLTLEIVAKTLFDADIADDSAHLASSVEAMM